MMTEFYRAMKVQTYRSSLAVLFINDMYYGTMVLVERLDDAFVKSRYNTEQANLYELGQGFYFQYLGSINNPYLNYTRVIFDNIPMVAMNQDMGTGDWSDVTMFTTVLTSPTLYTDYLQQYFPINNWLRTIAIDVTTNNFDTYLGTGNNFIMINKNNQPNAAPSWEWVGYDFDGAMHSPEGNIAPFLGISNQELYDLVVAGVTDFGGWDISGLVPNPNPYIVINHPARPLAQAVFSFPGANETFTEFMTDLVTRLVVRAPGTLAARRQAFHDLIYNYTVMDNMAGVDLGGLYEFNDYYNNQTLGWFQQRFALLSNMFITNGRGNCDWNGVCTCNAGWTGAPSCNKVATK